jgi:hypothetical protein
LVAQAIQHAKQPLALEYVTQTRRRDLRQSRGASGAARIGAGTAFFIVLAHLPKPCVSILGVTCSAKNNQPTTELVRRIFPSFRHSIGPQMSADNAVESGEYLQRKIGLQVGMRF